MSGASNPWRDLGILAAATVVFAGLAYWRFEKRDL
jgi:ABC-type transport system involved in multi-copper enzyme maturation permease subunit